MAIGVTRQSVLADALWPEQGAAVVLRQVMLVLLGILALTIAAKIRVPMWPVPVTMQTFAVLTIGAVYGRGLGLATLLGYLAVGALGVAVFTGADAGLAYMAGPTGGYLVGFAVAAFVVGHLAERGWSRSVAGMVGALLIGNAVIYAFGLPWMAYLFVAEHGWPWVLQYGMTNFLPGDAVKLMLAALLVPGLWSVASRLR